MISDFIVDLSYLARVIKDSVLDCRSWACEDARRLLNIICRENGRLMVPVRQGEVVEDFVKPLRTAWGELSVQSSPSSLKAREVLDSWRLGIENPPQVVNGGMMRRDIEVADGMTTMASLLAANPRAHAFITDKTGCRIDGQKAYQQKSLNKYFSPDSVYEKRRMRYLGKQTIIKYDSSSSLCFGVSYEPNVQTCHEFIRQLEIFSVAERKGFQILDRYAMGGTFTDRGTLADLVDRRMKILLHWVAALTKYCQQSGGKVDVYTIFPGRSYDGTAISYRLCEDDKRALYEQLKASYENWSGWNRINGTRPHVRIFFLDPEVEDFHDRFICSSTHYFAVGKGLDGIEVARKCKTYNVYYCGRRTVQDDIDIDSILRCSEGDRRLLGMYDLLSGERR